MTTSKKEISVEKEAEVQVEPEFEADDKSQTIAPEAVEEIEEPEFDLVPEVEVSSVPSGDVVFALSVVYQATRRNSMSVAAVQDRLVAYGHGQARRDLRGWFHDGTRDALSAFQESQGMPVTGEADEAVLTALFAGTDTEVVA